MSFSAFTSCGIDCFGIRCSVGASQQQCIILPDAAGLPAWGRSREAALAVVGVDGDGCRHCAHVRVPQVTVDSRGVCRRGSPQSSSHRVRLALHAQEPCPVLLRDQITDSRYHRRLRFAQGTALPPRVRCHSLRTRRRRLGRWVAPVADTDAEADGKSRRSNAAKLTPGGFLSG